MYNVYKMVMVVAVVFCSRLAFCRFSSRREALWIILPAGIANGKKLGILFARRLIFLRPPFIGSNMHYHFVTLLLSLH